MIIYYDCVGVVGLLFIFSGILIFILFCIGKVIDIIYFDSENMIVIFIYICQVFMCVFVIGVVCNMGRIYIMNNLGECYK